MNKKHISPELGSPDHPIIGSLDYLIKLGSPDHPITDHRITRLLIRSSDHPIMLHVPVMLRETIDFLNVRPEGNWIDATLGAGGHAKEILKRLGSGRLLGLDRDPQALAVARQELAAFGDKVIMQHGNFAQIDVLHAASGLPPVDGVVADLGLSSMQIDDPSRGFSFSLPGPLDMRVDSSSETTAADLVNYAQ